jgi:H+/Cl- antiporter ClcA
VGTSQKATHGFGGLGGEEGPLSLVGGSCTKAGAIGDESEAIQENKKNQAKNQAPL